MDKFLGLIADDTKFGVNEILKDTRETRKEDLLIPPTVH